MSEDFGGEGHAQGPIIVKRKYGGQHGHHSGAWKVAYADMVTALMALFIVLWILAQSDEFKANVAHDFQDPVGFSEGGTPTPLPGGARSGEPAVLDQVQPRIPRRSQTSSWPGTRRPGRFGRPSRSFPRSISTATRSSWRILRRGFASTCSSPMRLHSSRSEARS